MRGVLNYKIPIFIAHKPFLSSFAINVWKVRIRIICTWNGSQEWRYQKHTQHGCGVQSESWRRNHVHMFLCHCESAPWNKRRTIDVFKKKIGWIVVRHAWRIGGLVACKWRTRACQCAHTDTQECKYTLTNQNPISGLEKFSFALTFATAGT